MSDPTTALVELVANAWDAYATKVEIQWPDRETGTAFRIEGNGLGMTADEFEIRWRTLDYNRLSYQGATVMPPEGVQGGPRPVYGRNGKGRHAAFYFSSPYRVRTGRVASRRSTRCPRASRTRSTWCRRAAVKA